MASLWRYSITLVDSNALKTVMNYIIPASGADLTAEFTEAEGAAQLVKTALDALTDANFFRETLTLFMAGDSALPGDADITDEAAIVTYLTGAGVIPKFHTLRVPAPIEALFIGGLTDVDIANSDLITYVAELSADVEVSDGESINTAVNDGLVDGWWRSAKKSAR